MAAVVVAPRRRRVRALRRRPRVPRRPGARRHRPRRGARHVVVAAGRRGAVDDRSPVAGPLARLGRRLRAAAGQRLGRARAGSRPADHARVVNGIDERLSSMGGVARIRLESDVVSQAELEDRAGAIVSLLEAFEATLSRFRADSELSAFNRDPRPALAASPLLRGLARAARWAGARSRGLVDATLVSELEHQGYATSLAGLAPP